MEMVMVPLYRLSEGIAKVGGDVKELGEEVQAHLRSLCGAEGVLDAWNKARALVVARRVERRRAKAVESVVDPEAAAERKKKKHGRKREAERSKMKEVKRRKAAGLPLGALVKVVKKRRRGDD